MDKLELPPRVNALALLCCLAGANALLQGQAVETLSLPQALEQAVTHNPLLEAAASKTVGAEGLRTQAGLKPNLRLTVTSENLRAWEFSTPFRVAHGTDSWIYGTQTVERGAKRQSRIALATAGVERTQAEQELFTAQLRARVATAYWTASAAVRVSELYRQDLAAFEQIVDYNRQRVKEGAAAGADLLRVEIERDRLAATGKRVDQEAEAALINLLKEMGRSDYPTLRLTDALDTLPTPEMLPPDQVLNSRPELHVAQTLQHQQERNADLQKANALADPEYSFGYKRTIGLDGLYLSLTIPIPVRNRNQGSIAAAEADIVTARHLLRASRLQILAELETAQRDYKARKAALETTLVPLRARAHEAERIALGAYREGGVDLLRFLDAERTSIETDVLYYRSLSELQLSVVNLKLAQGQHL